MGKSKNATAHEYKNISSCGQRQNYPNIALKQSTTRRRNERSPVNRNIVENVKPDRVA